MSYETAPSTIMLATHCACCGRPLRDAVSVERGVGPDCAERYGYADAQRPADWARISKLTDSLELGAAFTKAASTMDARSAANILVHRVAAYGAHHAVPALITIVDALGFTTLAATLAARQGAVKITHEGEMLVVEAPWCEAFAAAVRSIPGRRWDSDRKINRVPAGARRELWSIIKSAFPAGTMIVGDRITILEGA